MLLAEQLHIGYKKPIAVADSLCFAVGDIIALVGRNGTGKSTLIQTLRGEIPALDGTVLLENKAISTWPLPELAQKIAWVNPHLIEVPHLSVWDYVLLGRTPYLNTLGQASSDDAMHVNQALDRVNGRALSDRLIISLSDGERQLVSIARAIAQNTPFIFLDEPTAFLDFYHRKQIFHVLVELAKSKEKGILVSTHDLDLVTGFKVPLWLVKSNGEITVNGPVNSRESLESLLS